MTKAQSERYKWCEYGLGSNCQSRLCAWWRKQKTTVRQCSCDMRRR